METSKKKHQVHDGASTEQRLNTEKNFYHQLPIDYLDPSLLIRLSRARCLQWSCLPIYENTKTIVVATHPDSNLEELSRELRRYFDKPIHWILCPEAYLRAAIKQAFIYPQR